MREKCKSKHKFSGAKVQKAEQVRKYFVNSKIENEVFGQYVNYIIFSLNFRNIEAVVRRDTSEQVFLKILQCSQEKICIGVFFKYADLETCNFIKKRLQRRFFPLKLAKFLRLSFFTEHVRQLLLEISHELSVYYI